MQKIKKGWFLSSVVFFVAFLLAPAVFAKKDNDKSSNSTNSSKSAKSANEKVKELKNYEKSTKEKTNAAIHQEKINTVSAGLKRTADEEKGKGQQEQRQQQEGMEAEEATEKEIAEEIEEVANETETTQDETVEAIVKVEEQNKFKKLLIGTDYKNLGQLRSSLVHNRNQIKKLTALISGITDEETKAGIEAQLTTLMQERERIKVVISENEEGFSLLGWAFRFMNGYPKESINEQEEAALEEEVAEVIEDGSTENADDQGIGTDQETNNEETNLNEGTNLEVE